MKPIFVFLPAFFAVTLFACGEESFEARQVEPVVYVEPACVVAAPPKPVSLREEALARDVADAWMDRHPPTSLHWDWVPAVLMYGFLDLYEATGEAKYRAYVEKWIASHATTFPMIWSDTVAPTASAARAAKWSCREEMLDMVARTDSYLRNAPRTEAGGIGHLGLLNEESPQLWVDSLFMFGSFLMGRHALYAEPADLDRYAEQVQIFAAELQDESGFFRHALIHETPWPASAVFWGRGNGWVANVLARFLAVLPQDHPAYAEVARIEAKLLNAVLRTQDASGLWWTVLTAPGESYLETSATALFADSLRRGAELGLIDAKKADAAYGQALAAVKQRIVLIDDLTTVTGTSTATQPGGAAYYASVPIADDVAYGVGSVLLMLTTR